MSGIKITLRTGVHMLLNLKSLRKTEKMNLIGLVYVWAKDYTKQWNDSAFSSDSDVSLEELCFSPILPLPDVPEQQDKCLESSWKLVDSNICLLSFRRGQTKWTFIESYIKSKDHPGATHLK